MKQHLKIIFDQGSLKFFFSVSTTKNQIQTYSSTVLMLFKCIERAQSGTSFDQHFLFSSRKCLHELKCVTGVHLFCLLHVFTMYSTIL